MPVLAPATPLCQAHTDSFPTWRRLQLLLSMCLLCPYMHATPGFCVATYPPFQAHCDYGLIVMFVWVEGLSVASGKHQAVSVVDLGLHEKPKDRPHLP